MTNYKLDSRNVVQISIRPVSVINDYMSIFTVIDMLYFIVENN